MKKLIFNKQVSHNYEVIKVIEAGIELKGFETKSIKLKEFSITEAFVSIENNEAFIKQMYVKKYEKVNAFSNIAQDRIRKLLLHRKEILDLSKAVGLNSFTIVPRSVYINNKGLIKIEICLVKGKTNYDKRNSLKKKTQTMDMKRSLKDF